MEVENALLSHPAVDEVAVVGSPDNDQLIKPRAYVVPAGGHSPSTELASELVTFVSDKLAAYKRPRWVEFIDELPKTATGKIQRYKLRQ
jgi:acyl-coenzyme A synthetase/AMP-(fatty) acid ligase